MNAGFGTRTRDIRSWLESTARRNLALLGSGFGVDPAAL